MQNESINTNHLSIFEAVLTSNRENQVDKACLFDPNEGNVDYLYVNNPPEMDFTTDATI
jgi:hypothetical protein